MATLKYQPTSEETVWLQALIAATWPILLAHDGKQLSAEGAAHLTAEFADAALVEFRNRFRSKS